MKTNTHIRSYLAQFFLESNFVEKKHVLWIIAFSFFGNHAIYELKVEKYRTSGKASHHIIRRKRIECRIPMATNAHSEYACPLQQWLHEEASMLHDTYIATFYKRDGVFTARYELNLEILFRLVSVLTAVNPSYTKPSSSTSFTKLGSSEDPMGFFFFCNFSTV